MPVKLNHDLGLLRVGAAIPEIRVSDVNHNIDSILRSVNEAHTADIQLLVFPELAVTGFTIGDLVQQQVLLSKAEDGLAELVRQTANIKMIIVIGVPLEIRHKIFSCAVIINSGRILGIIPKSFLPGYKEFYEERWFSPAELDTVTAEICGQQTLFGTSLLIKVKSLKSAVIGIEICEDLWVPLSPHEFQALAGANILVNLSASNEILGKSDWRRTMITSESGRCLAAYCYTSCGINESSNDIVYSSHAIISENGIIHEESKRLTAEPQLLISDIDVEHLVHDRTVQTSFHNHNHHTDDYHTIEAEVADIAVDKIYRKLNPHPFVPKDPNRRAERCRDIFAMQVAGLAQKLKGAGKTNIIIGVSGGLDSTLALLVAVKTMDFLKLSRQNIHAYTLPGFGTTVRTKNNATRLCQALGVTFEKVDITNTCEKHLKDVKHEYEEEDIVFENVQARYRTALLFNIANHFDGIVLGTGDLTEIALGWATFSGDHMSHYHVNASVPKTLVKYVVRWVADEEMKGSEAPEILYDILETPISPELLRPRQDHIIQKSEEIIGPVELADYFLYPFIRFGTRPGKILFMANETQKQGLFEGQYSLDDLHNWLASFIKRFFANQFKRTCMPEGPKVGTVSLSPRGDWRMPSEASPKLWLDDLESMYGRLKKAGLKSHGSK